MREERIVCTAPASETFSRVGDVAYRLIDGDALKLDVYRPARAPAPLPTVVLIHGDGSPDVIRDIKDWGQYISWGELLASTGIAAVTFNHRSSHRGTRPYDVASDIDAALNYIASNSEEWNLDPSRLGLWACSLGVPFAMRVAFNGSPSLRCLAALYGPMEVMPSPDVTESDAEDTRREFSPLHRLRSGSELPPLLIARAGRDQFPRLNDSIDAFVMLALAQNREIDLLNHPSGSHGFDVQNDCRRSRDVIEAILNFYRKHL